MAMFFAFLRTFACASLMLFWSESRASDSAEFKPGALLRKLDDLTLAAIKDRDVLLDQAGIRKGVSCDPIIRGYYSKCEGGRRVLGGDLSVMMRWFGSDVENGASSAIYIRNIESVISPEKLVSDYLSGWWEEPQVNRFSEGGSDLYLKGVCVVSYRKRNSRGVYMKVDLTCDGEGQGRFVRSVAVSIRGDSGFL